MSLKFDYENLSETWRNWKEELELFSQTGESDSKPEKV